MRVAFFGLPLAALLLHHDGHRIVYAGICRREALGVRRVRRVLGRVVRMVPDLSDRDTVARVRAAKPDLIVSWFWTKRLPKSVLAIAPAIGVHPSLLPRHRGPDPYFWAIDRGDRETGVTAHVLDREYDTGAILGRKKLRIEPTWSSWTLAKKLDRPSLTLLREIVSKYQNGTPPKPVAQPKRGVTEAPSPTDDDLELRWRWSADRLVRRIRAASPWPGAFTELGGETLVVTDAEATDRFPLALAPGEAAIRADGAVVVRAGTGAVRLLAARREYDESTLDEASLRRLVEKMSGENPVRSSSLAKPARLA